MNNENLILTIFKFFFESFLSVFSLKIVKYILSVNYEHLRKKLRLAL